MAKFLLISGDCKKQAQIKEGIKSIGHEIDILEIGKKGNKGLKKLIGKSKGEIDMIYVETRNVGHKVSEQLKSNNVSYVTICNANTETLITEINKTLTSALKEEKQQPKRVNIDTPAFRKSKGRRGSNSVRCLVGPTS